MNGLTDTLTLGLALTLVFGALFFYLYSRLAQAEKRISLTENILLDLKMATENSFMKQGRGFLATEEHDEEEERTQPPHHVQSVSAAAPLDQGDVDSDTPDESFYQKVLDSAAAASAAVGTGTDTTSAPAAAPSPLEALGAVIPAGPTKTAVEPNYESMTRKELKALAEQRGVNLGAHAQKKEIIEALKRQEFPAAGSVGGSEGFPVDLGAEEIPV